MKNKEEYYADYIPVSALTKEQKLALAKRLLAQVADWRTNIERNLKQVKEIMAEFRDS